MQITTLLENAQRHLGDAIVDHVIALNELTLEIQPEKLREAAYILRDEPELGFEQCMDVCGVDYLAYGASEWETFEATSTGFERGVERLNPLKTATWPKPRFAAVYHLLSLKHNWRLRLRVFPNQETLMLDSLISVWPSVNWFEREAFDMFGFLFKDHPDLRRIMTDYGFIGHPFRKDFPLSGNVEVRYDAASQRVIYEPVELQPRVLVPKVIRKK
jgi:NADH-quinone oxidoreductase subunit C